jgi:hypothetical protein
LKRTSTRAISKSGKIFLSPGVRFLVTWRDSACQPFFWTQKQDIGPSSRTSHGLTYDGARKRVLLFAGDPGGPPLADTWDWDSTLWTQVADTGPSARQGLAMAFDPTASRVVLFGGAGTNGAGLNDTWLWDGTDWTQAADTGPDPRAGSAMVAATTTVLFGGVNSIDPDLSQANRIIYGDSWRWDGKVWTKVQDIGPAPRWGHGMAFRSDTRRIVLFSGSSVFGPAEDGSLQAGVMRDTWEHPEVAGGTGVEVKSVAATSPIVGQGGVLRVDVALTGPAPVGGVNLVVGVTSDTTPPTDVSRAFAIPSLTVAAGESSVSFQMTYKGGLPPGNYGVSVAVQGGVPQTATFTILL